MTSYQINEKEELAELVKIRRAFHRNPELGLAEFWTTARIAEHLEPLGCQLLYGDRLIDSLLDTELLSKNQNQMDYKHVKEKCCNDDWIDKIQGITGLVAIINGKEAGPKFAFRFDIDGLPISESNEYFHLPYKEGFHSSNGCMHACGHDGHIAIGLGLAKRLTSNRGQLKGVYYLLFQPAEEVIIGGRIFSKLNFIKELDYFIPIHLGLTGERKVICGLSFLSDRRYRISFTGRSAHSAAFPERGQNALLAACCAATGLYGISRHSSGYSRINIGCFRSDNASNIIADKAELELDLRGESNDICEYLVDQAKNIISGASQMQNVQYEIKLLTEAETAINSKELISQLHKACIDIGIPDNDIIESCLLPASDDATFIMNEVTRNGGLSTYVGICCQTYGGHHNNKFDFDEDVLLTGVNLLNKFIDNVLSNL